MIANRLGVGPMHDCLSCAYEEFFLSAHTVGDVGTLVDVPANVGLEHIRPGETPPVNAVGVKATMALYPSEPANVHHSYIGDFTKFRNTHNGHEQHIFHLHGHQWLFNPNDDNSDYIDAQGIGAGGGYTYEIANGARVTATGWRAMLSITATSIRISPKACGLCGGCTMYSSRAPAWP